MRASTEFSSAAFSGAVFNNSRKPPTRIAGTMSDPRLNSATIITGTPTAILAAETR